jgi:hypothetical protein
LVKACRFREGARFRFCLFARAWEIEGHALVGRAAGLGGDFWLVPAGSGTNGVVRSARNSFKGIRLACRAGYLHFFSGTGEQFFKDIAARQAPELKYGHCFAPSFRNIIKI